MAAGFSLFGTCFVMAALLRGGVTARLRRGLLRLAWGSVWLFLVAGAAWFLLQSIDMSGAQDMADLWAAVPVVAGQTRFGTLLIGRLGLAVLAMLLLRFGAERPAALAAGGALVAEAWLGHGGAMSGAVGEVLLVSSVIHLASGGAWLGSLPALRLAIRLLPIGEAGGLARRFSPIGIGCVAGICASAVVQFVYLIGGAGRLLDNGYGLMATAKILVLMGLIGFAAVNRFWLTPALVGGDEGARGRILRSIAGEMVLGLLILLAAGVLLQLAPPSMAAMLGP